MPHRITQSIATALACLALLSCNAPLRAEPLTPVADVEAQPLAAQAARVADALNMVGAPLEPAARQQLAAALAEQDATARVRGIQQVLDPLCLAQVNINPESRVKVARGLAAAQLMQHGWSVFLVKVINEAGVTAPLRVSSPNAAPLHRRSSGSPAPKDILPAEQVEARWMDVGQYTDQPLAKELSALKVEYRVVELYSRDAGKREAKLMFDVGQGTQDLGFRSELNVLFDCAPAQAVTLRVLDTDGRPTTGHFVFRDGRGRVYPSRTRRLAPDFFFHDQVYRADGENVLLPPGKFTVVYGRGPEYRVLSREINVVAGQPSTETFSLRRWIKLADQGWYSGDHHVHAAGCSHYESPTEGVQPADMMRHILGEDLNVGCVLSWGPCWYHQKQFFEGKTHSLSTRDYLMRYDVEVSGFPSSHCGHLCLLRLKEDDYRGVSTIEEWPSWDLPILQWGQEQGSVVGFSHSGWGLKIESTKLPNLEMPKFDGIGANEYIVDTVHGACDFISTVDTPAHWELNIWYHTLNCGMTTRISGETDFPCIYGERIGLGRSYVKLGKQQLDYDTWAEGIRQGRSYVSDGLSHVYDFKVEQLGVGEPGAKDADGKERASVLAAKANQPLKVTVNAAAWLDETPKAEIRNKRWDEKPYWHPERARLDDSRRVPVELLVNGQAVERREIAADGTITPLEFTIKPGRSCWVAVRILPTSHTNPIWIEVDGQPVRASRASAQWCLDAVDVCWNAKQKKIRDDEREAAAAAYEVARQAYRKILAESAVD
ncbi:MAG: CehA/McbA family metallohydrolase [Planctomycetes bacterium]|nr:CehA/McbA family metallohydrolase [Planctomycetota bacterium]